MEKKVIYIDMDGVLSNYRDALITELEKNPKQKYPQSRWGFFIELKPIKDAIQSFNLLNEHFDVYIVTKPSIHNINSYTEKAYWILNNLGQEVLKKTIFTCDKSKLKGDYLIDDYHNANQSEFQGEWIHFNSQDFPDWRTVIDYILKKEYDV